MAMDTDNLLEGLRASLAAALKDPTKITNAHHFFTKLDEALSSGADLPDDWLTPATDDDDDEPGGGDIDDEPDDDGESEMRRLAGS